MDTNQNVIATLGYSPLIGRAIALAVRYHAGQVRKGDGQPYIVHPVHIAIMLAQAGYPDTVIAAGLCHDLLEDTACTPHEIGAALGDFVLQLVQDLTEQDKSLPWEVRKERHLEHLKHASPMAMAIAVADKLHNLEGLYAGVQAEGLNYFGKFNRGLDVQLRQAHRIYDVIIAAYPDCPLLPAYASALARLEAATGQQRSNNAGAT